MRKPIRLAALAALVLCLAAVPALAQGEPGGAAAASPQGQGSQPHIASVREVVPPRRKVVTHRFRPWARPTPRQVRQIIRVEAARWHVAPSRLSRRVACESRYRWSAGNGSFRGLLQFHSSTFARGLRTIRTRRVRMVRERTRTARVSRVVRYSDGRVERRRGRPVRQRVVHVYVGTLPRRPAVTHGWAQLRIGAQAIRGGSAVRSSEWSCPA